MKNILNWSGMDCLTIKMIGTGEYVKKQCAGLVETFRQASQTQVEVISQEQEDEYHYQ